MACPCAGPFFTYLLVMFLTTLDMSALFRFIGAVAASETHAQAYAATSILILIITSGFAIIRSEYVSCRVLLARDGHESVFILAWWLGYAQG
jgi:hypothetical protein